MLEVLKGCYREEEGEREGGRRGEDAKVRRSWKTRQD